MRMSFSRIFLQTLGQCAVLTDVRPWAWGKPVPLAFLSFSLYLLSEPSASPSCPLLSPLPSSPCLSSLPPPQRLCKSMGLSLQLSCRCRVNGRKCLLEKLVLSDTPDQLRSRGLCTRSLLLQDLLIWLMSYRTATGPAALRPTVEAAGLCAPPPLPRPLLPGMACLERCVVLPLVAPGRLA